MIIHDCKRLLSVEQWHYDILYGLIYIVRCGPLDERNILRPLWGAAAAVSGLTPGAFNYSARDTDKDRTLQCFRRFAEWRWRPI